MEDTVGSVSKSAFNLDVPYVIEYNKAVLALASISLAMPTKRSLAAV